MILAGHLGTLIYSTQAHPYWLDRVGTSRPYLWAHRRMSFTLPQSRRQLQ